MELPHIITKYFYSSPLFRMISYGPNAVRNIIKNLSQKRARSVVSFIQKNVEEDIVVSVGEFQGRFQMPASSDLFRRLCMNGHYEPILSILAMKHTSSERDAIDVGANIGFYTVLLSKSITMGKVLAIEPNEIAHKRLLQNIARNHCTDRVITFDGMAGSKEEAKTIYFLEGMEEYTSVVAPNDQLTDSAITCRQVKQTTIDTLVARYSLDPAFIKVDVEGYEFEVLTGALQTIRRSRPVILCELNDEMLRKHGSSASAIVELLRSNGYRTVDPVFPSLEPGIRPRGDVLALPQ